MKHFIILSIVALIMALTGYLSYLQIQYQTQMQVVMPTVEEVVVQEPIPEITFKEAPFTIDGVSVTLKDGVSSVAQADSNAMVVTQYFGNEVEADVNNDGMLDTVFLVTQNSGGSGTFFYVVATLKTEQGYQGTNAVLLGDRIAPQSSVATDEGVLVTFATRAEDEPISTEPSVGVSKLFTVQAGALVEVLPQSEPVVSEVQ
jgi:hypothetical protein